MKFLKIEMFFLFCSICSIHASGEDIDYESSEIKRDEIILSRIGINSKGQRLSWHQRKQIIPVTKDLKREMFNNVALDEFSGALDHAHRKGIKGKEYASIIMEDTGIVDDIYKRLDHQYTETMREYTMKMREKMDSYNGSHGTNVTFAFHQIAPEALAFVRPIRRVFVGTETWPWRKLMNEKKLIAVNMSFGNVSHDSSKDVFVFDNFAELVGNPNCPLFIKGAENELGPVVRHNQPMIFHMMEDSTIAKFTIFVGALAPNSSFASYTGFPGKNEQLQKNWICTIGTMTGFEKLASDKLFTAKDLIKHEGTSFAAPIVTGAAVLVANYVNTKHEQNLAPLQIKEILLNSANRNIFMSDADGTHRYIYDPEDPANNELMKLVPEKNTKKAVSNSSVVPKFIKFDNEHAGLFFGNGILDLKNAFIYADIKVKHGDWTPQEIRTEMLKYRYEEESKHATSIQRWWRAKCEGLKRK